MILSAVISSFAACRRHVVLSSSIESSNSFKFEMDSSPELDLESNSAYDFACIRQDTLKLLDKASCYELLSKVSTLKSEILLQHLSLKTPSLHYHDSILNLEKTIEGSLTSASNTELNSLETSRKPQNNNSCQFNNSNESNHFPSFNSDSCYISSPVTPHLKNNIQDHLQRLDEDPCKETSYSSHEPHPSEDSFMSYLSSLNETEVEFNPPTCSLEDYIKLYRLEDSFIHPS